MRWWKALRDFFAPTTDFRVSFWNTLPADPFYASPETGGRRERSCVAGRIAAWRSSQKRWYFPLQDALLASARIADAVIHSTGRDAKSTPPDLWGTAQSVPTQHPSGHTVIAPYRMGLTCEDCAWSFSTRNRLRCRHTPNRALPSASPACTRYEPADELDCQTCGACCREAYDSVELSQRDPMIRKHPDRVLDCGSYFKLKRSGDRCSALSL